MKKYFALLLFVLSCSISYAQSLNGKPVTTIPQITSPVANHVFVMLEGNIWKRMTFDDARNYFGIKTYSTPQAFQPTSTGNTQYLNTVFKSSVDNKTYCVGDNGTSICLDCTSGTAGGLYVLGNGLYFTSGNHINAKDSSMTNEIQTLSRFNLGLKMTNGSAASTFIALPDSSAINEIQTLSLSGNTVSLSNSGGSVNLGGLVSPTQFRGTISASGGAFPTTGGSGSGGAIMKGDFWVFSNSGTMPSGLLPTNVVSAGFLLFALQNSPGSTAANWSSVSTSNTVYTAGTGIGIAGNVISNSGDLSPLNEIQTISLSGNTLSLSNSGGSVTLPTGTTYTAGTGISLASNVISATDPSLTNEIQTLSRFNLGLKLTNGAAGSTFISLPDSSSTNELQTLSLSGSTLSLSNTGGSVTLPTGTTYTAGAGVTISGNVISADDDDNTNEIQTLSRFNLGLKLTNGAVGSTFISLPDSSSTNEIQTLSLSGNTLSLSNSGGSVTLPSGSNSWGLSGNSISGSDFIGTTNVQPLTFKVNSAEAGSFNTNKYFGVGIDANRRVHINEPITGTPAIVHITSASSGTTQADGFDIVADPGLGVNLNNRENTPLVLSTNNSEKVTVHANGNVSIGTSMTTPTTKLDIDGQIRIRGGTPGVDKVLVCDANGVGTWGIDQTGPTYQAGSGISINSSNYILANDVSPTNELQLLSLSGNTLSLSNFGGSVTLPTGTTYTPGSGISISGSTISANDVSASNELQTISLSGNTLSLSNSGGSVTLPSGTDSQTLSLSGASLSISNGNSVTLPTGTTYTAGSGISIAGNAISATDNSVSNELQTISLSGGSLSLSNGGGSVILPSANTASLDGAYQNTGLYRLNLTNSQGGVGYFYLAAGNGLQFNSAGSGSTQATIENAGDLSNTNEIQSLSISGSTISLSSGGGSVSLPASKKTFSPCISLPQGTSAIYGTTVKAYIPSGTYTVYLRDSGSGSQISLSASGFTGSSATPTYTNVVGGKDFTITLTSSGTSYSQGGCATFVEN